MRAKPDVRTIRRKAWSTVKNRMRLGIGRVRTNFSQLLQATIAAVAAYSIAKFGLGHEYPFLAAVAAAVGVGVTADKRVRRSLEIGIGATLGVLVGELLIQLFGVGLWQMFVIMIVSFTIGHIINGGSIFVTQMGIQAIYVVTVPPSADAGVFSRTEDALIGSLMAILIAAIVPRDPRKEPRRRANTLLAEIADLLEEIADAARRNDHEAAVRALSRARETQSLVDSWRSSVRISQESTRLNPAYRRYAAEVTRLSRALKYADRAMRLIRVISRRLADATVNGRPRRQLANAIDELASGANALRIALNRGTSRDFAQDELSAVVGRLAPKKLHVDDIQGDSIVLLLRPLAVDLLQAAGYTAASAAAQLPPIEPGDHPAGMSTGQLPQVAKRDPAVAAEDEPETETP